MSNADLNKVMQHYRVEVTRNVNRIFYRKLITIIGLMVVTAICLRAGWHWALSIIYAIEVVLYFIGFYTLAPLAMNDAFLVELAKLDIQDTEALDILKAKLKSKAYILYEEAEDFIEREITRRALNERLLSDGAVALLGKDKAV